jgi:hypothetical protein
MGVACGRGLGVGLKNGCGMWPWIGGETKEWVWHVVVDWG